MEGTGRRVVWADRAALVAPVRITKYAHNDILSIHSVRITMLQCPAVPGAFSRAGALGALGTESPKSGAPGDWGDWA